MILQCWSDQLSVLSKNIIVPDSNYKVADEPTFSIRYSYSLFREYHYLNLDQWSFCSEQYEQSQNTDQVFIPINHLKYQADRFNNDFNKTIGITHFWDFWILCRGSSSIKKLFWVKYPYSFKSSHPPDTSPVWYFSMVNLDIFKLRNKFQKGANVEHFDFHSALFWKPIFSFALNILDR